MVLQYPDPMLLRKALLVKFDDPSLPMLIRKLRRFLNEKSASGISAPQIGVPKRVAIAWKTLLINPRKIERKHLISVSEKCLSLSAKGSYFTTRPDELIFSNYTPNGKKYTTTVYDEMAHIVDHEIDHLDGILGGKRRKL
jgi:peptide deformylase